MENPRVLAEFLLAGQTEDWSAARIQAALQGADNIRVDLETSIPVFIFYTTAIVREDDEHQAARALRIGGVGYYPGSDFIHVDTGRVRAW